MTAVCFNLVRPSLALIVLHGVVDDNTFILT